MKTEQQPGSIEKITPPKIKYLEKCSFPIIEKDLEGYKVLVLPQFLQEVFDKDGYDAIRINSLIEFPVYGGTTTVGSSLLPHQDHSSKDPRRFLALSKNSTEKRGSLTYIIHSETVERDIPKILAFVNTHRDELRKAFVYDQRYQASEQELLNCFEPDGIDQLLQKKLNGSTDPNDKLFILAGILGYIVQGPLADVIVKEFLTDSEKEVASEDWTENGIFIIDNSKVFHGRFGDNRNPLQRNWFIAEK